MKKSRIIIVEDDQIIAKDIKNTIESHGYSVVATASSGEEAILKVGEKLPDLVIMDVKLKGELDGIDAALQIKTYYDVPVVYLTSYVDNKTIARAKITGPMGYILKPFEEIELCTAIEIALYKDELDKKLRENERWLATILKSIGDAVIATDREGRIRFINAMAESLIGWKGAETLNRPLEEVFRRTDEKTGMPHDDFIDHLHDDVGREGIKHTVMLISKTGAKIPIDEIITPIKDDKGAILGTVVVFNDVTERKKIDDYMRMAKENAEAASEEKNRFLAHISHEIRTPLNAITGFAELMKSTVISDLQKDYINTIHESGNVLLALIGDILDISRIEAGRVTLQEEVFDLESVIENVVKMVRLKIKGHRVIFNVDLEEMEGAAYIGDSTRISQVLLNLINNAIKFTSDGEVLLKVSTTRAGGAEPAPEERILKILVKDTGIGIPADKQKIIFEAFAQVDTSVTRQYGGTGLGLTISKAFVEMMGGSIRCVSEEGAGTEFHVTVKLRIDPVRTGKRKAEEIPGGLQGRSAVIIDGNRNSRSILETFLRRSGIALLASVATREEFIGLIENASVVPDFIISDVFTTSGEFHDFPQIMKEYKETKEARLIGITRGGRYKSMPRIRETSFDSYLPRPLMWREFITLLETGQPQALRGEGGEESGKTPQSLLKGKKVLMVEDNVINQKLQKILLTKLGCEVELAGNGREAIEKVTENNYHAILMDLSMPVLGGIEATTIIRKDMGKDLPIIALTAYAGKEDQEKCYAAGMNDYIAKPIKAKELEMVLIRWLSHDKKMIAMQGS